MFKVLMLALLALPVTLLAGGSDGGGGNGVVCFNPENSKEIISVELLDFYEGRVLEGYEYSERPGDYLAIYNQVSKEKAASKIVSSVLEYGNTLNKGFKFLPKGVKLRPIDDSDEIFIPENCRIEQIANFQGPSRIFIVSDYWNLMSETNKAGLLMHEQLWWKERKGGYPASSRARRTVARFFADNYEFEKFNYDVKLGDFVCLSDTHAVGFYKTSFLVSSLGEGKCKFSFISINGAPAFTNTELENNFCTGFFEPMEIGGLSVPLEVKSFPGNETTHTLRLNSTLIQYEDFTKVARTIEITNLEFPGFNDQEHKLYCHPIDELVLNNPWW